MNFIFLQYVGNIGGIINFVEPNDDERVDCTKIVSVVKDMPS